MTLIQKMYLLYSFIGNYLSYCVMRRPAGNPNDIMKKEKMSV